MSAQHENTTLPELSESDIKTDYWFIIEGKVIDYSDFLWGHPGGPSFLNDFKHKDATAKFEFFGHSERAHEMMEEMVIGKLKAKTD